ncbi:MAG: LysM peptidoglycan-binding domain-containing protein [Bacilli bacterium]|nr:LysM peptidoglycan-binding domain-containing protein [Bacilli bacterium]
MKYTVKRGDTLYGISNQFGVSVTELASLNGVNANTLQIGQVLTIPEKFGTNPDNLFYYTVKKGDTVFMGNNEY